MIQPSPGGYFQSKFSHKSAMQLVHISRNHTHPVNHAVDNPTICYRKTPPTHLSSRCTWYAWTPSSVPAGTWYPPRVMSSLRVRPKKDTDGYRRSVSLRHRSSSFISARSAIVAGRSEPAKIESISWCTRFCTSGASPSRNRAQLMPAVVVSWPCGKRNEMRDISDIA